MKYQDVICYTIIITFPLAGVILGVVLGVKLINEMPQPHLDDYVACLIGLPLSFFVLFGILGFFVEDWVERKFFKNSN